MVTLGKQIQVIRILRDMKQGELAKLVNLRQPTLSEFETNKSLPTPKTLERIKAALAWPDDDQVRVAFRILAGDGEEPHRL